MVAESSQQVSERIAQATQPWWAAREVVYLSPSAAIAWGNAALTRPVSLLEHDSVLLGLLSLRDTFARPEVTGAPSWRAAGQGPYLTIPHFNARSGLWVVVPVAGAYARPADPERARWYDAITALVWRIADLTTAEPASTAAEQLPADARLVAVFGENREVIISTPGLQFREHAETVRLVGPFIAGAYAAAEQAGRAAQRVATALDAQQLAAIATAMPLRDALATERETLSNRGTMRAATVAGLAVAAAYGYSRM